MKQYKPTLYLIRGLPGSGKSTLARSMSNAMRYCYEADDYFYRDGVYCFNPQELSEAHQWCKDRAENDLKSGLDCIVSNTSTTEKEVEVYAKLAEKYNANFVSIVVENRHGNSSVHNVPAEKVQQMKNRFSIKL